VRNADLVAKAETVKDFGLRENMPVKELVEQMRGAWGFTSEKIVTGIDIVKKMVADKQCLKFLSFPACIVATGTRGVLKEMVRRRLADVVMTTCGTLDHDLARCWKDYYQGSFDLDDAKLHKKNINRLGNVLVPNESYGIIIEEKMQELLSALWDEGVREVSSRELCWEMGRRLCNESSILYWAAKNKIPVYVPGITDGAVGYQLWLFSQDHNLGINLLKDEKELNDLVFDSEKTGALVVGGGISKHHVIWWNQFKGGLDYAVYLTTAVEWDGSLSGAKDKEAVSWGKVKETAKRVTIEGDATVILPLMVASIIA
jgi:deoxyhypusine synthase